ncbi:DUF4856 domain-containing protein [Algivirga pacifica]|uniref:DUF4856 domain-containing protein n=1 Tax=Algivirga pacifica TaxID=1162670 RepID=A0ABP9D1Q9_9BACT
MNFNSIIKRASIALLAVSLYSCNGEEMDTVKTTYDFENVSYSGQTARIQMLDSLSKTIKAGTLINVTADQLSSIYENTSGELFGSSKDLKSKTFPGAVAAIEEQFDIVEAISGDEQYVIGGRLYNAEGVEPAQIVEKGLMGSVLYYQAVTVYLGEEKMDVDNETVEEGKGTAMQHHWDEAFGYFGAPTDFLNESTEGTVWFWAKYANGRKDVMDFSTPIFNAFIAGRQAINDKDYEERDRQIAIIKENWEKVIAATTIHYVNASIADIAAEDMGAFYHHWSEAKAFADAFLYNIDRKISTEEMDQLATLLGDVPADATTEDLQAVNTLLQEVFGFTADEVAQF